jgi:hypothetical protein
MAPSSPTNGSSVLSVNVINPFSPRAGYNL